MRRLIIPVSLGVLSLSFTLIPSSPVAYDETDVVVRTSPVDSSLSNNDAVSMYEAMSLEESGLSKEAFTCAWKGYHRLLAKNLITRTEYLTICDFSQSSRQKRLYLVDMENQKLILNTWVAHGRNSGGEYANKFSNRPESLQSSLGFYITQSTYIGAHGLSLRLIGVDGGHNDRALNRNIVIHGAAYVGENWLHRSPYLGRSWGCPALPQEEAKEIITTIKNGTCLFIYHPSGNYLRSSKILND